jgi:hypothetical protein
MLGLQSTEVSVNVLPTSAPIALQGTRQQVTLASAANGLTALAGGGQAGATPITTKIARFTTVATGGDSSLLPKATVGNSIRVKNAGAASMNVFPATGEAINAGAPNAQFAVANGKSCDFFCAVAGIWDTLLSA